MDENTKAASETSGVGKTNAGGETDKVSFTTDNDDTGEYEYWFYKCLEEFNDPDK
jgi:hypothetical protein